MRFRKNWFYYLAYAICLTIVLYALAVTLLSLGNGQEYPYLLQGRWLLTVISGGLLLAFILSMYARLEIRKKINLSGREGRILEAVGIIIILLGCFLIRFNYIQKMPMHPESDYKTYFEVAQYLMNGNLVEDAPGYCDYIAIFPHVLGYPRFLCSLFRITGVSVFAAETANVVLYTLTVLFLWLTVRMLVGRLGALNAAAIAAFMPSTILYSNFVASEYLFTFQLMVCICLFTLSLHPTEMKEKHPWTVPVETALLGFLLAVASTVRPMAQIFLIAAMLCLLRGSQKLPAKPKNDLPLALRCSDKGYKRCMILLIFFMSFNKAFTASTAYTIDRELAGGSSSFGYNLLVGLNSESNGGWNDEDSAYLYQVLDETGSPSAAQEACRDLAFQRLQDDPDKLLNLFIHKYQVLWGNDDYGASWNILFMRQQGNLTAEREAYLFKMRDFSDLYYAGLLVLVLIETMYQIKKRIDSRYAITLLFLGTAALHILVENQNRYHFHALLLFALLGGCAVADMEITCYWRTMHKTALKEAADFEEQQRQKRIADIEKDQKEMEEQRAAALHAQFDMASALRNGHVKVIASNSVQEDYQNKTKEEIGSEKEDPFVQIKDEEKKGEDQNAV